MEYVLKLMLKALIIFDDKGFFRAFYYLNYYIFITILIEL